VLAKKTKLKWRGKMPRQPLSRHAHITAYHEQCAGTRQARSPLSPWSICRKSSSNVHSNAPWTVSVVVKAAYEGCSVSHTVDIGLHFIKVLALAEAMPDDS